MFFLVLKLTVRTVALYTHSSA